MGEEFLEEEPGVGIDRFGRHVARDSRRIGKIRSQGFIGWSLPGSVGHGLLSGRCLAGGGTVVRVRAVMASAMAMLELMHHEVRDLLEGDLRGFLTAPVSQRGTGGLAVFKTGDVVAGIAGKLGDRLLADVLEQHGIPLRAVHAEQHPLVAQDVRLISAETVLEHVRGLGCREPILEVHHREFIGRLPLVGGERARGRNVARLPVLGRAHQVGGRIGGRVTHLAVGERDRLEQHVGHDRLGMVTGWLAKPAVEPGRPIGMGCGLRADPREIRTVVARRLGEVGMLVAGQTAAHLKHLLTAFNVGRGRDAVILLHVVEGGAGREHVVDHRANLDRLIPLRFLEPLALEVLPQAEEPRHLRRGAEVLRIAEP